MSNNLSLLSAESRVEIPYVLVTIGEYTFGSFHQSGDLRRTEINTITKLHNIKFPNYIKRLVVKKINGQFNKYTLEFEYPITDKNDPNFFEKVFSAAGIGGRIIFSYGDMSAPNYIYRNERAVILKVREVFSMATSTISYTVDAVSDGALATAGVFTFQGGYKKPSDEIKKLLTTNTYNLTEVFTGMRDKALVEAENLIASDDRSVELQTKVNISILDYITYLVSCMQPADGTDGLYTIVIVDDTSGKFDGCYFKVVRADKGFNNLNTYEIDIGYPSGNIVTAFSLENNEAFSVYYKYAGTITDAEYAQRINNKGELEDVYAPIISSDNDQFRTNPENRTWWKNVTQFPVKASITLKGILRPAILMQYVHLNMYYYGRKHIATGTYVISGQTDEVSSTGFRTTLSLVRVDGDMI